MTKFELVAHSSGKLLAIGSLDSVLGVHSFNKKYSVPVYSVLVIFSKSTRLEFTRFWANYQKILGFFYSVSVFFLKSTRFFNSPFCSYF